MRSLALVTILIACAATAYPQTTGAALSVPSGSVWVESGKLRWRDTALRVPQELREASGVTPLFSPGSRRLVWTEEVRDDSHNLQRFRLAVADLASGTVESLITDADPFGVGADWRLLSVNQAPDAAALLLRIRLGGTGGQSEVRKVPLTAPHTIGGPVDTLVWDAESGDGAIRVMGSWALTEDRPDLAENQRRYATLIVGTKANPRGRALWTIQRHDAIPEWADWYIESVALSGDGRLAAYSNPRGLWVVPSDGKARPRRWWAPPEGESCSGLVWSPDGSGLFFTRETSSGAKSIAFVGRGSRAPVSVLQGAEALCVVRH